MSDDDGAPSPPQGEPLDPSRPEAVPARPAGWAGLRGSRADLRTALVTVAALAVAGVVAGLVWWQLAPRADFRITDAGPVAIGDVSNELLAGDDVAYLGVLSVLGLVAAIATWLLRRHRGVPVLVSLALGMLAASVVAWQLGERLGTGPTAAQLTDVGRTVTTALDLNALAAVAIGPFLAVLVYLLCTVFAADDDLDRGGADAPPADLPAPVPAAATGSGLDAPRTGSTQFRE